MNPAKPSFIGRWSSAAVACFLVFGGPGTASAQSPCGESVTVSLGDTLNQIAANCNTTVRALVRANPDITNPDVIHVGQVIRIPGGGEAPDPPAPPDRPDPPDTPDTPGARIHTVSAGETLAGIAARYGTTVSVIVRANASVTNPNIIHVGQVLTIPGGQAPPPREPRQPRTAQASITPTSGPPGTSVRLTGSGFPANARVRVGQGRAQSEYDLEGTAGADAAGRVSTTARVPSFADAGERWVFVLVTDDGSVRAISNEFRVTAGEEEPRERRIEVTGVLTDEGVECPALRADDGTLYTLAGDLGNFGLGDRVHVHGTVAGVSICQQGTTVRVERITAGGGP